MASSSAQSSAVSALAGPLAGLLVAVPVLLIGLAISPVERLPLAPQAGMVLEGNSILYLLALFALLLVDHGLVLAGWIA